MFPPPSRADGQAYFALYASDATYLGTDAAEMDRDEFRQMIAASAAPLKARLLDQNAISGIGNLLADEVLWQSAISPSRRAKTLDVDEADELRRVLRRCTRAAIRKGGVHTGEIIPFRHADASCPRCGAPMKRGTVGGRTTWWCSTEQA